MLTPIVNAFDALVVQVGSWAEALSALFRLIGVGFGAATAPGGFKQNAATTFADPANQRLALAVLRVFMPNLSLSKQLVKAYENTGTVIVTRREDVLDVLHRDADFAVVYGPRMRKLTDGENFFLDMQPGWPYTRDTSAMRLAARMSDVPQIVLPRAAALAEQTVAESAGRLDLPPDLTLQVPWDMTEHYFGVAGPDAATMQDWTTTLF
jgi:hypothetical protein